jgi:hypothetical protein
LSSVVFPAPRKPESSVMGVVLWSTSMIIAATRRRAKT